ncbi:LuxR C-terminal-related transcriptional regulator [Mesorhizobium sp. BAC0120]|uniref:helix-turn-helix transcriptional regulator n=1 Tax=Mesorhizobium sp. BAC0120 TaxID=3090670 RepID=UPI00298CA4E6|nr:LuxR C-terminal-related transcriptional regulator [Mesorhizobium sp. BAC0120]MDW6023628.1 LuxR C-terminal-related transcriptional regulator [Mesorhizobium sp. BAC0120]
MEESFEGGSRRRLLSQPEWFAALGELLSQAGSHDFPETFASTVQRLVPFDYTVSFAYSGSAKPICLHHTFGPKQFDIHVKEYEIGPYLLDPLYKATANGVRSGLYRLADLAPDQFYKSEYYKTYYVQTGPVDEIGFFISGKDSWIIVTSLMRAPSQSAFSVHDLRTLRAVEPLVRRIAEVHWRTDERLKPSQTEGDKEVLRRTVQEALRTRGMPPLTPRELDVVGLVLEGHSSESIANLLGISAGTVRIHRKNIYAKMRISSQRELFSIFVRPTGAGT